MAEELSFRRAAERLHVAQPVLSRQIRALEEELSVRLFDRGPRGTVLTEVGEQLLVDATSLLSDATAAARRVHRAASPQTTIAVGVMPGLLVTAAIASFRSRQPQCRVDIQPTTWANQVTLVRDGSLDLSLAREPFDGERLQVVPIASEDRLALVPRQSALAESESLTVDDLASLFLLQDPALLPQWAAATTGDLLRRAAEATPPASVEEKLERVAQGEGFVVLPRSTSSFYRRPDVRVVPVQGLPLTVVSLVMRQEASPVVRDLADAVVDLGQAVVAVS